MELWKCAGNGTNYRSSNSPRESMACYALYEWYSLNGTPFFNASLRSWLGCQRRQSFYPNSGSNQGPSVRRPIRYPLTYCVNLRSCSPRYHISHSVSSSLKWDHQRLAHLGSILGIPQYEQGGREYLVYCLRWFGVISHLTHSTSISLLNRLL